MSFHDPEYDPPGWQTRPNELRGIQMANSGGDAAGTVAAVGLAALTIANPVAGLVVMGVAALAERASARRDAQMRPAPPPQQSLEDIQREGEELSRLWQDCCRGRTETEARRALESIMANRRAR